MIGEKEEVGTTQGKSAEGNIAVVARIYAAFKRGDVPGILANIAEDVRAFGIVSESAKEVPWHLQITNKKDVPRFFKALADECDFTSFEPRDFATGGDHVYCTVRYDVTLKRNGKKLRIDNTMHHFILKGGRVIEWRGTEDTARIRDALAVKG